MSWYTEEEIEKLLEDEELRTEETHCTLCYHERGRIFR